MYVIYIYTHTHTLYIYIYIYILESDQDKSPLEPLLAILANFKSNEDLSMSIRALFRRYLRSLLTLS